MRTIILLNIFLFVFNTACVHKHNYAINSNDIKELEIIKGDDSVFRKASPKEYSVFTDLWNNAKPQGLSKYYAEFRIKVTLQNDSIMNFRTYGASIKFNNDSTYDIGNKLYFQKLWNDAR